MRGMLLDNEFEIGQTVYLKTDTEQYPRIVTSILIRPNQALMYYLSCGAQETQNFDLEISAEPNLIKRALEA
jgi:hypothetical protein